MPQELNEEQGFVDVIIDLAQARIDDLTIQKYEETVTARADYYLRLENSGITDEWWED